MGTHCLVKEFHPKFHVEVIRRPYTCAFAQLVRKRPPSPG